MAKIHSFDTPLVETPVGDIPSVEIPSVEIPEVKMDDVEAMADNMADSVADTMSGNKGARSISEEVELAGNQLVEKVKGWIDEGTVRRLILRNADNKIILEIPVLAGVFIGGMLIVATPLLAVLGVIGSALAKVKVEVVRGA